MEDNTRRIIGSSLLGLMIAYILMVVGFTHIHIIDGVLVVESHPDIWGDNHSTVPTHPMDGASFFHQSQTLGSIIADAKPVLLPLLNEQWSVYVYPSYTAPVVHLHTSKNCPLRAPPTLS